MAGGGVSAVARVSKTLLMRIWGMDMPSAEEFSAGDMPKAILDRAREVHQQLIAEARDQIARIAPDDPDRLHNIYRVKQQVVQAPRRLKDVQAGYPQGKVNQRHKDRVRASMSIAAKFKLVPAPTVKGPACSARRGPEEQAKKRKAANTRRRHNLRDRVAKLKITVRLCSWYAQIMEEKCREAFYK